MEIPEGMKGWTRAFRAWLTGLAGERSPMGPGARVALGSLLRQKEGLEQETKALDGLVSGLADTARYAEPARAMAQEKGVGIHTSLVILTELGDLRRFGNRRAVGSYVGLTPSSRESGEIADCKGHITHQGPWRVRRVLCQAAWARVRTDANERTAYERIAAKNPKHKKIAVVAVMRRLMVRLWHIGREAQERHGCFEGSPKPGGERPRDPRDRAVAERETTTNDNGGL
jgi:transposase